MGESSYFWDGTVTGDADLAPYSAYKFREVWRKLLVYDSTKTGIIAAPVFAYVDSSRFTISPFAALVNGVLYISDATETKTINRFVGSNSVSTLFLRMNRSLKTVRMSMSAAQIFSTYGTFVSPTQTSTIWEIPIANIFATPTTYYLYPVVGHLFQNQREFIPLIGRQGNNATDWSDTGTTDYTPTNDVKMQAGVARWTGGAAATGNVAVTFPYEFDDVPICFVNLRIISQPEEAMMVSTQQTATTLTIYWRKSDGSTFTSLDFNWLAIGPLANY